MKISQVVAFSGFGEDQNISLATEIWKINNRWKTPLAVRHIAKIFTAIGTFLNNDWRCSPLLHRRFGVLVHCGESSGLTFRWLVVWSSDHRCFRVLVHCGTATTENLVIESSDG